MLAIITVVYKNYEVLHDFILSLSAQSSQQYSLIIVDLTNENERQIIPWVRKIEDKTTYITRENIGYAYGVNEGMRNAMLQGRTLFAIVNPDVVLDTLFVQNATYSITKHPRSIMGGKIYYAPGYEYHNKTTSLDVVPYPEKPDTYSIWFAGGSIDWSHALVTHEGVDQVDQAKFQVEHPTGFVTGCCMIYDKTVHDIVGAWDTNYFMYYEDADFCVRAVKKNIKLMYDPSIVLWHKNAQSTGGSGSPLHVQYMDKSRLRFGLKHAPFRTKLHLLFNYAFPR